MLPILLQVAASIARGVVPNRGSSPSIDVAISRVCAVVRVSAMSMLYGSNVIQDSPCLTQVTRFLSWLAAPNTT